MQLKPSPGKNYKSQFPCFIYYYFFFFRLKLLEEAITNDSTCVALATTALEKFAHKPTVLEWLRGQQVANLLSSSAEQAIQSEEILPALWQLLRVALGSKSPSNSGQLIYNFIHRIF